jgi:hypothetical protein
LIVPNQRDRAAGAMISANIATVRYRFRRVFGLPFAIDHFKNETIHEDGAHARNYRTRRIIECLVSVWCNEVKAMPSFVTGCCFAR